MDGPYLDELRAHGHGHGSPFEAGMYSLNWFISPYRLTERI